MYEGGAGERNTTAIETAMVGCRVRLAVLLSLCVLINSTTSLDVLSFNIKRFGPTKYSNQDVIDVLIQVELVMYNV